MALKDILVHIDNSKHCPARLQTAVDLAARHDAHLTGLYVVPQPNIPPYVEAQLSAEIIAIDAKYSAERAEAAEEAFKQSVNGADIRVEWRTANSATIFAISSHVRYADLAVVGQRGAEEQDLWKSGDDPDDLILNIGRPVLMVPYIGAEKTPGDTVLVAWDASRLAARAVHDAMPILKKAKKVVVLAINPEGGAEGHGDIPGADIAPSRRQGGSPADPCPGHRRRRHPVVAGIGLKRRSDRHGCIWASAFARVGLRWRHAAPSQPHDGAGVDVSLTQTRSEREATRRTRREPRSPGISSYCRKSSSRSLHARSGFASAPPSPSGRERPASRRRGS
jgi:nucleotide-binding universal stress UspA family protein